MDVKVVLFLLVLGTICCCNARGVITDSSPVQIATTPVLQRINEEQQQEKEVEGVEEFGANEKVCALCVKITKPVLSLLQDSSNQEKIVSILDKLCSITFGYKDQCTTAVNYYLPAFYTTISVMTPRLLCVQIGLCGLISDSQHLSEITSESCHDLVTEVLSKVNDPSTQLNTIEMLLKACDSMEGLEGFAPKCKTLVSVYALPILRNAKKFVEKYDICTILHPYSSATNATMQTQTHSAS